MTAQARKDLTGKSRNKNNIRKKYNLNVEKYEENYLTVNSIDVW